MSLTYKQYREEILPLVKQEYKAQTKWAQEVETAGQSKDKMKMINLQMEKFNLTFDDALIITEHLIDKKPFTDKKEEPVSLTKQDKAYIDKLTNVPKCQICGSTNIKKISTAAKVTSIAMFGLLGNKRRYQWHCNSDF